MTTSFSTAPPLHSLLALSSPKLTAMLYCGRVRPAPKGEWRLIVSDLASTAEGAEGGGGGVGQLVCVCVCVCVYVGGGRWREQRYYYSYE